MTEQQTVNYLDVEGLVELIGQLTRLPGEERDAYTVIAHRLHLARNADDCIELFIEGPSESFDQSALGRGLEYGQYRDARTGCVFSALVIRSATGGIWERPMAHLAYEAIQAVNRNGDITNEELLAIVSPYLRLVVERHLLSAEQQIGLTGELIFLQELLIAANSFGISGRAALDCWKGWDSASRDFKGGGVAVEVKATGGASRQHWIHPIYQLLPNPATRERVYIFSLGLRIDRSRDFRLTTVISRVLEMLAPDLQESFRHQLGQYGGSGFAFADWRQYKLEPGFLVTLPPSIFRVDNLKESLRPEAFVDGRLPSRVADLRYVLSLEGLPIVTHAERDEVLQELLSVR